MSSRLKECCQRWLDSLQPMNTSDGRFIEVHICPTCSTKFKVTFKCIGLLGSDDVDYQVVAADPTGDS